jgi:hypothetical protein
MSQRHEDESWTENFAQGTEELEGVSLDCIADRDEAQADPSTSPDCNPDLVLAGQPRERSMAPDVKLELEILRQIANFGAHLDDLLTLFGPARENVDEVRATGARNDLTFSEERILALLERWKKAGLVELDSGAYGEPELYVITDAGMVTAGFPGWNAGLAEDRDGSLLDRGGTRGRLLASVGAALALLMRSEQAYRECELLSVWGIRRQGRVGQRYRFQPNVTGPRYCPMAVLDPREGKQTHATAIEVFDGSQERVRVESICRLVSKGEEVGHLRCYTTPSELPVLLKVVRELDASDRVSIYVIPDGGDAVTIAGLSPRSVLPASEMSVEERKMQVALLHCVGEFGSASFAGLRDYLGLEEDLLRRLVERSLEDKLLKHPRYTCDSVELLWLTESGCNRTGTRISKDPVTFEQAWLEKESLRVAPSVANHYPSRRMTTSRILARSRKLMPLLGPAELGYRPVLLVSRAADDSSPVAVVIVVGMRTEAQLRQMVDACVADRKMSQILIYSNREMLEMLKFIVSSRDNRKRIVVKALPVSERVQRERAAASKRRAALADKQAAEKRRTEREAARAIRAVASKTRSECHEPELPGLKPITDQVWGPFNELVDQLLDENDQARNRISTRFVANLLIWMIENEVPLDDLRSATHGINSQLFRERLRNIRRAGLFSELQRLVEEHEDRGPLDWGSEVLWAKPGRPGIGAGSMQRLQFSEQCSGLDEWPWIMEEEEGEEVMALLKSLELDK